MERPEPPAIIPPADRSLLLIGAGILALLVASVAVVLIVAGSDAPDLEPGSPEAVVRDYLAAYEADDLETAYRFFSTEMREEWGDARAYRRAVDAHAFHGDGGPARRAVFDRSEIDGDSARVHLTVEEFSGDGLSGDTYRSSRVIRMVREGGAWRIDQPLAGLDQIPPTIP